MSKEIGMVFKGMGHSSPHKRHMIASISVMPIQQKDYRRSQDDIGHNKCKFLRKEVKNLYKFRILDLLTNFLRFK